MADVPAPEWLDGYFACAGPVQGTYLGTRARGRVGLRSTPLTDHGLDAGGPARVGRDHESLVVVRTGTRCFRIPAQQLIGARHERGVVAKFRGRAGLVAIVWRLGRSRVVTDFRTDVPREARELVDKVRGVRDATHPPHGKADLDD